MIGNCMQRGDGLRRSRHRNSVHAESAEARKTATAVGTARAVLRSVVLPSFDSVHAEGAEARKTAPTVGTALASRRSSAPEAATAFPLPRNHPFRASAPSA